MATTRSYRDRCAAAHALDIVGERWALLIVRELVLGPKRFTDLRAGIPQASPNVLSQRLRELAAAGVVVRRRLPPPAGSQVYELTTWGRELEDVILALGRWGCRSPHERDGECFSADSLALALKTNFDGERAGGRSGHFELRVGDDRFLLTVSAGQFGVERGDCAECDAAIAGDPGALAAVFFGEAELDDLVAAEELSVEGDTAALRWLITLFAVPEPATVG